MLSVLGPTVTASFSSILRPISQPIGWLLAFFYSVVPPHNLGVAIVLLTCAVMLVLFPLTAKQARSMIAMQKVQPEIKKIQQKYKDDRTKQNEEIMKFYQENKINPLAGCLPLLMQMPIFFALFEVLRKVQDYVPKTGQFNKLYTDICGSANSCRHPKGLPFLGMDLSVAAKDASKVASGFLGTLPYFVLIGLVVLTGWYQARQTMSKQPSQSNTQAQLIGKVMPIAFGVFSISFASGLVVYFVASNVWRIGQQQLVLQHYYDEESAKKGGSVEVKSTDLDEPAAEPSKPKARPSPNAARKKQKKKRKR